MKKWNLALVLLLFATLIGWNIFLTIDITERRKIEKELRYRLDACDGDNMVLRDELITTKDSLRILNKYLSDTFKE